MSTKKFIIDGKTFYSVREMCRHYNITHAGFHYRRKKGHSILNSLKSPKTDKRGPKKRSKKENIEVAIKKLQDFAKKNKIIKLEDWYEYGLSQIYKKLERITLSAFKGGVISAIQRLYPNQKIYPWLFPMAPMGFWEKKRSVL